MLQKQPSVFFFQILIFWILFVLDVTIRDCILRYIKLWLEVTEYTGLFGRASRAASRLNLVGALPNSFLLRSDSILILMGLFGRAPRAASGLNPVGAMPNSFFTEKWFYADFVKWFSKMSRGSTKQAQLKERKHVHDQICSVQITWTIYTVRSKPAIAVITIESPKQRNSRQPI